MSIYQNQKNNYVTLRLHEVPRPTFENVIHHFILNIFLNTEPS